MWVLSTVDCDYSLCFLSRSIPCMIPCHHATKLSHATKAVPSCRNPRYCGSNGPQGKKGLLRVGAWGISAKETRNKKNKERGWEENQQKAPCPMIMLHAAVCYNEHGKERMGELA